MLRNAASKAAWAERTASMVFGLALVMALVLGVAATAWSATGGNFLLGKANVAGALTKLTGDVSGAAMQVANSNAGADDTALSLRVQAGEAPMKVNSSVRVANLNAASAGRADSAASADTATSAQDAADADQLDGKDSSEFATDNEVDAKTADVWGYVRANGELVTNPSANIIQVTHPATGEYCVVTSIDYSTYLSPQVTLAEPGSTKIASVGTGYGSSCNPLYNDTQTPIPVYIRTPSGTAANADFSVFVPAPN